VVTGGAGWLGRALLAELGDPASPHHRPGRVRALVHRAEDAAAVQEVHPDAEVVVGDVTCREDVAQLFDGSVVTDVIHTAGVIHPRSVAEFERVNAGGTRVVVEAAARAGVRRLVHVSSNSPFGVNPDPGDTFRQDEPYHPYLGYGRSKMHAELAVLDAVGAGRLDAVVVRPPWFYGPWQPERQTTFFRLVRAGRFPVIGGGGQRRSMVYVANLVQGIVLAELTPTAVGRGYWVADARPYPVHEIIATVSEALRAEGYQVRAGALHLPDVVGRIARAADALAQRMGVYQQQLHVLGEMGTTIACDIGATQRDLGYQPTVGLLEGMRTSIRWCQERGIEL
jgi:nucleoside-diphosphate-sugar epimerase